MESMGIVVVCLLSIKRSLTRSCSSIGKQKEVFSWVINGNVQLVNDLTESILIHRTNVKHRRAELNVAVKSFSLRIRLLCTVQICTLLCDSDMVTKSFACTVDILKNNPTENACQTFQSMWLELEIALFLFVRAQAHWKIWRVSNEFMHSLYKKGTSKINAP